MFDYMVVSKNGKLAYAIGTKLQMMEWQMRHGMRAITKIIYLPSLDNERA